MGYYYANNSIELLNHCEVVGWGTIMLMIVQSSSTIVRLLGQPLRGCWVGCYYTNNSIELLNHCEVVGWGTIILMIA